MYIPRYCRRDGPVEKVSNEWWRTFIDVRGTPGNRRSQHTPQSRGTAGLIDMLYPFKPNFSTAPSCPYPDPMKRPGCDPANESFPKRRLSNNTQIHHCAGDFKEACDVRAVDIVARGAIGLGGFITLLMYGLHNALQPLVNLLPCPRKA